MVTVFQDNFNSDSGKWTDVDDEASVSLSGGAKVIEKTNASWEKGGTYFTDPGTIELGDIWAIRFKADADGNNNSFYKFYLRLDDPAEGIFTREGYGVYIEGGDLKFDNGGNTSNAKGLIQKDQLYTIVWRIEANENINVYAFGGHLSGVQFMGATEGTVVGRKANFVANIYSAETIRLDHYAQLDVSGGI